MSRKAELHPTSGFTVWEERWNAITHIAGAVLSVAALVVAVVFAALNADVFLIVACAIYGASLFLLLLASSLYHSARDLKWKRRFLVADHSCIYLLIAGTYTPFALGPLRGPLGWTILGTIWGLAMVGVLRELLRPQRGTWISTGIYLAMGWTVVLFFVPLARSLPTSGLVFLVIGGVLYTIGTLFYKWHSLKYHHAIWHVMVVAAATFQFFAVMSLITD